MIFYSTKKKVAPKFIKASNLRDGVNPKPPSGGLKFNVVRPNKKRQKVF